MVDMVGPVERITPCHRLGQAEGADAVHAMRALAQINISHFYRKNAQSPNNAIIVVFNEPILAIHGSKCLRARPNSNRDSPRQGFCPCHCVDNEKWFPSPLDKSVRDHEQAGTKPNLRSSLGP